MDNTIATSGSFTPTVVDTPLDIRTRVASKEDIENIPLPYEGMLFYVKDEGVHYVVKSLKSKEVAGINIDNAIIDKYEKFTGSGDNGGGGNNTAPTVTSTLTKKVFTVDEEIIIPYFVIDGEGGSMEVFRSLDDVDQKPEKIEMGANNWNVGALQRGTHRLKLYVKDRGGLFSNQLVFDIQVGALELVSSFNDKIDYKMDEEVIIGYTLNSMGKKIVNMKITIDGNVITKEVNIGFNNLNLGKMQKGVHLVELQSFYDVFTSNTLSFHIVVTDANSLYLSTSYNPSKITNTDYISIPYRISLQKEKNFITYVKMDDVEKPSLKSILGINSVQIGLMETGIHTVEIYSKTLDGTKTSNVLKITLNVVLSDFKPYEYTKDGLMLDLSALGKSNLSQDKNEWKDKSPYNRKVSLNNFNFNSNGWIDNTLVVNGEANCIVDVKPFEDNCPKGLTVEFYFKYKETSAENCQFVRIAGENGWGLKVDDEYAYLNSSLEELKYPLLADEFIHVTYVIDWETKFVYIYINGCISAANLLYDSTLFTNNSNVIFGACVNDSIVDCAFKSFRIYNRALKHEEVLSNFASCKNIEQQKEIAKRNSDDSLPEMDLYGNFDGMGKDKPVALKCDYKSKGVVGTDFSSPKAQVEWQGDSTLQYSVKNYSIKLYDESGSKYFVKPVEIWPSSNRIWTKANMMDSSSVVSAGMSTMFSLLYKEKTPPMMDKKSSLYTIQSFPILMYENDRFKGVYTWMLPPQSNPTGQESNKPLNYSFGCEENAGNGIGAFNLKDSIGMDKIPTEEDIKKGWENYTDSDGGAFKYLAKIIKWVNDCYWKGADNYTKFPDFRKDLNRKFNIPFLLDYYIYCYVFGMVDSLGKNLQLYSFGTRNDEGDPIWYTTFFDFDTALGCDNKGEFVWKPDMNCPSDYNTPHSLLWEMVRCEYAQELKDRYIEMRRSNLTNEKFKEVFYDGLINTIGEKYYNMDALNKYFVWGSGYIQMFHGNKWLEMKKWFKERLIFADTFFGYNGDLKHTIILRNTHSGNIEYDILVEHPQYITTSFGGAEGASDGNVVTKMCKNNEYTPFRYSYNGSYQKDAYITSASEVLEIKGLAKSDLVMLDVQHAKRLRSLDISDNPKLTATHFDNCEQLESFNASGCTSLTSVLNFNNSPNLRSINLSKTGVTGIVADKCNNIENLDLSESAIKAISITGDTKYAPNIKGCTNIESILVRDVNTTMDFLWLGQIRPKKPVSIQINNLNTNTFTYNYAYDWQFDYQNYIDNSLYLTLNIENCNKMEKVIIPPTYLNSIIINKCSNLQLIQMSSWFRGKDDIYKHVPMIKCVTIYDANKNLELDFYKDNGGGCRILDLYLNCIPKTIAIGQNNVYSDYDRYRHVTYTGVDKVHFKDIDVCYDNLKQYNRIIALNSIEYINCHFIDEKVDCISPCDLNNGEIIVNGIKDNTTLTINHNLNYIIKNITDVNIVNKYDYNKIAFQNCKNIKYINSTGKIQIINEDVVI